MKSTASFLLLCIIELGLGCASVTAAGPAPAAAPAPAPAAAPAPGPATTQPTTAPSSLSDVHINQEEIDRLQKYWEQKVAPHKKALQEAAEAHYKVISDLRQEQQRLIDEADRIQRTIDKLEKEYQDMTTPRPEGQ